MIIALDIEQKGSSSLLSRLSKRKTDGVIHSSGQENLFPVIYSTLAPDALVALVLRHYEIGAVKNCQFWRRGLSDVYLVETEATPYILRVSHHHWRSSDEIDFELELLDFWRQRQLPVAYPLRTKQGQLSVEINAPEGKRYGVLFSYAPGRVPLGDLNSTQSHQLGQTVAQLHQAAEDFLPRTYRPPLTLEYLLEDSVKALIPFLKHRSADLSYLLGVSGQIEYRLRDLPQKPPFWSVCWGDPHSGNAHFTPDNQLTLFDFDQCGYGWRAFDLAKFLQVSLGTGLSKKVREAFLAGYQAVCAITAMELSSLQALTQTAHIWTWAISLNAAKHFNWSWLDERYFTHRLEQLKMLTSSQWQLF